MASKKHAKHTPSAKAALRDRRGHETTFLPPPAKVISPGAAKRFLLRTYPALASVAFAAYRPDVLIGGRRTERAPTADQLFYLAMDLGTIVEVCAEALVSGRSVPIRFGTLGRDLPKYRRQTLRDFRKVVRMARRHRRHRGALGYLERSLRVLERFARQPVEASP